MADGDHKITDHRLKAGMDLRSHVVPPFPFIKEESEAQRSDLFQVTKIDNG